MLMHEQAEEFAKVLGEIVAEKQREFDQAIAIRDARFKAFEAEMRLEVRGIFDAIATKVASLKDGKDGAIGPEGKEGPPGRQGEAGINGRDGAEGAPGPQGLRGDIGPAGRQGETGPQGQEGIMGLQGLIGERGPVGERGGKGEAGRDGTPGRDGLNGLQGERGASGIDGRNGVDGKDGAGFETWTTEYDNERQIILRSGSGDRVKEFSFDLPIPIYRGRYKAGDVYRRGDEVTFGGNVFRALKETTSKPGESDDWFIATNRGRDGRDGKDGAPGPQGPEGKPGRDLTQLGPDGKKW